MASKQQVMDLNLRHPDWTARDIAEHLGCAESYVFSLKGRYGLKFSKGTYREKDPNSARNLGRAAKRAGLTVGDIERMGKRHG